VKPLGEPKYKKNTSAKVKQAKVRAPKSKKCKKVIGQPVVLSFHNTSLDSNGHILLNTYPKGVIGNLTKIPFISLLVEHNSSILQKVIVQ